MTVKHDRWAVKYIDRRPGQGGQYLGNEVGSQWKEKNCKDRWHSGFWTNKCNNNNQFSDCILPTKQPVVSSK